MSLAVPTLEPGARATWSHVVTAEDVEAFAELSGDRHPIHLDDDYARSRGYRGRIAHGMLLGAFVSRVLGMDLPGSAGVTMSQRLEFAGPVYVGDRIEVEVELRHASAELGAAALVTTIRNAAGEAVARGEARSLTRPRARG